MLLHSLAEMESMLGEADGRELLDCQDKNGATALHIAVFNGQSPTVEFLIAKGAALEKEDRDKSTPLHSAAFKGHTGCVELLVRAGANVNHPDVDSSTPLHKAAYAGASSALEVLLRGGADKEAADVDGVTALQKASFNGHSECVKVLLEHGAKVDQTDKLGSTALHKAAFSGSVECVKVLTRAGAKTDSFDSEGHSPAHLACHKMHPQVLRELLAVNSKGIANLESHNDARDTPVHMACKSGSLECVVVLADAGADLEARNAAGDTPIESARRAGHRNLVDFLAKGKNDDAGNGLVNAAAGVVSSEEVESVRGSSSPPLSARVDRWGFLGSQDLTPDELEHKRKEIERESKWVVMRNDWDRWTARRMKKLRMRCLKGIPDSFRPFAWIRLSGALALRASKSENYYQELVARKEETAALEVIHRDLHRTFPDHLQFREVAGRNSLLRVLKAFSFHNPTIGYCQGMGFVAAMFLMYCVEEQDAFWMLVQMVEKYGMGGLWDSGLTDVPKMCFIHSQLLARFVPKVYAHLDAQGISGALYAPSFYITGFTYSLPWPCVLRVWDAFLCDGMAVLHAVGVALLEMHSAEILALDFEKLMPFLRFNHIVEQDGREAAGGHISHVKLSEALLKWLPKVSGRPISDITAAYMAESTKKKKK